VSRCVGDLNRIYRAESSLHRCDFERRGFEWVDFSDAERSIISFLRWGDRDDPPVLAAFNFTPEPRAEYGIHVPREGFWQEIFCSDAREYGGSGYGNFGGMESRPTLDVDSHLLLVTLPPLGAVFFKHRSDFSWAQPRLA
jgi:1,4-alpha-glucan branching enzyme